MKNTKKLNIYFNLGLLIFIFIGPLIFAIGLYLKTPQWLKQKTLNNGIFISPPIDFDKLKKKIIFKSKSLRRWQVFYLTNKECKKACRQRLYILHQIITALGKNSWKLNPALIQVDPSATVYNNLFDSYSISVKEYQRVFVNKKMYSGYYLIDTQGKIILYYPTDTPGEDLYKDLLHLL
ncbi:MAG: hypothetical protein REH83_00585 [Rickettsiella sp.]|nr:hypothetical protein [Rickettsiella sp.]